MRPLPQTFPPYFEKYISLIKEDNVINALQNNLSKVMNMVSEIPANKEDFAYADGKWTIKQVVQHIIDTERILSYRALRFARKDPQQPLAFDENVYAFNSNVNKKSLADIVEEFVTVRAATLSLYKSFNEEALLETGTTTMGQASVLAIGFFICGHGLHHLNVIKERYLLEN